MPQHGAQPGADEEGLQLVEHWLGPLAALRLRQGFVGVPELAGAEWIRRLSDNALPDGGVGQQERQVYQRGARGASQRQQAGGQDLLTAHTPGLGEQLLEDGQDGVGHHLRRRLLLSGRVSDGVKSDGPGAARVDDHHVVSSLSRNPSQQVVDQLRLRVNDQHTAAGLGWIVLGVVEGLNPWKDEDHARTREVPR